MIRFARKPDSVFSELMDCAITEIVDNYLNFDNPRDQEDWLCASMPRGARFFTAPQAKEQLLAIQKVYHDERLYQLTKYHWLLLYECLETFAQGFNEQPVGWLAKNTAFNTSTSAAWFSCFSGTPPSWRTIWRK